MDTHQDIKQKKRRYLGHLRCRGGCKPSESRGGKAPRWWPVLRWWRGGLDCGSVSAEGAESARVSRDAFVPGPPTARGGQKHARSVEGRRRGDGRWCGDDSGGFRRRIGRVIKEERPREGSTSWSFACVKSDGWRWRERVREDLLCHICKQGD